MTGLPELRIPAPRSPLADRLAQFDLKSTGDTIIDGYRLHVAAVSAKLAASEAELAETAAKMKALTEAVELIASLHTKTLPSA